MDSQPYVSVVVTTYNRKDMLKDCVDSLLKQTYPADKYEVIVVDDGSTDGTEELLKAIGQKADNRFKGLSQGNQGISAARNLGIQNAVGEIVCFTDDDCVAEDDWVERLVEVFSDEKIGGVGGKIIGYEPKTKVEIYAEEAGLLDQEKFKSNNFLIGCNSAYRKGILQQMGGFDAFMNACEDLDISLQTILAGYELRYESKAVIHHNHRPTLKGLFRQQYRNGVGFAKLHRKYTRDFNPTYNILVLSYRLLSKVITYPLALLGAFSAEDKVYHLTKPFLEAVFITSILLGIMNETLFGKEYEMERVDDKLVFMEDQSIGALIKKISCKISL